MKQIRNMRELGLMKQNLKYRLLYYEDKLKDRSGDTLWAVTGWFRKIAFEAGMRIMLNLFFSKKKRSGNQ